MNVDTTFGVLQTAKAMSFYSLRMKKWTFNAIKDLNLNYRYFNVRFDYIQSQLQDASINLGLDCVKRLDKKIEELLERVVKMENNLKGILNYNQGIIYALVNCLNELIGKM